MPAIAPEPLTRLIGAVRRRLWREAIADAVRRGGWATAAAFVLGAAVRVAVPRWADATLLGALLLIGVAMPVQALRRRPDAAAAALWADRHLGGASAFTTWRDLERSGQSDTPAARRLASWATDRVAEALSRLRNERLPMRLARPWAAAVVCAALAVFVRALPQPSGAELPAAGASATGSPAGAPLAAGRDPAWAGVERASERSRDIAAALRESSQAEAREAPGTHGDPGVSADRDARTGTGDRSGTDRPADPATGRLAGPRAAAGSRDDPAALVDAQPPAGAAGLAGAGSGREAGDSRDDRAQFGRSRAAAALTAVQRSPLPNGAPEGARQADATQSGTWNERLGVSGAPGLPAAPAAATAAQAERGTALTASETSYLRSWLKTAGPRR